MDKAKLIEYLQSIKALGQKKRISSLMLQISESDIDLILTSLTAPVPDGKEKTAEEILFGVLKEKIKTNENEVLDCSKMMHYLYFYFNPSTCMKFTIQAMELYASQFKTNLTKTPDAG